jgi:hypothetical protein
MITLPPALLVLCGRWVFWPARPKYGSADPAPRKHRCLRSARRIAGQEMTASIVFFNALGWAGVLGALARASSSFAPSS